MLGGISISMDAAAYVRDLERKQRELGLLYGLLALTGVLAVGGITSNLTLRRLQAEEKSRLKSAFMGRLSHDTVSYTHLPWLISSACSSSGISVIRTAPRSPVRIAAPIPPTGATTPRIRSI